TGDFGFNIFVVKLDRNGNFRWAKKIPAELYFYVDIAVDANENVYVTSNFKGTVNLDPQTNNHILTSNGGYDALVVKLNSNGSINWVRNMGGLADDYGLSLQVDNLGNVYSSGFFRGMADFD